MEQRVKAINQETIHCFTQQALVNLVVQQVVRCRQGGLAIVNVLLQYGASHLPAFPRDVASEFPRNTY